MIKLLQGETIPENIFTQHEVINADNIREHLSRDPGLLSVPTASTWTAA